jgi:hypothetical protein
VERGYRSQGNQKCPPLRSWSHDQAPATHSFHPDLNCWQKKGQRQAPSIGGGCISGMKPAGCGYVHYSLAPLVTAQTEFSSLPSTLRSDHHPFMQMLSYSQPLGFATKNPGWHVGPSCLFTPSIWQGAWSPIAIKVWINE